MKLSKTSSFWRVGGKKWRVKQVGALHAWGECEWGYTGMLVSCASTALSCKTNTVKIDLFTLQICSRDLRFLKNIHQICTP